MTKRFRAGGCAGSRYPFLTQKERDVETGLDYFLARYYSSTQGRFTSPDEFTGGPDELFTFVHDASNNPTFYADVANPQSLNKYQYAYGNPLRFVDADGHDAEPDPEPQDPCGCKLTKKQVGDLQRDLEKLDEATSKPLLPITDTIGTSTPPPLGPVALPDDPTRVGPNTQSWPQGWPKATTGTPPTSGRQPVPPPPITMGKGSTRDVRKINPGREASAKTGVQDARAKVNDLRSKPNKTPADKEALRRAERELQRQLDRLKKSETDARKGRGDRR